MSNLQRTIERLAQQFAQDVLRALRGSSLDELARLATGGGARAASSGPAAPGEAAALSARGASGASKRLARRSADDIGQMVERIVALLASSATGLGAEALRGKLGVTSKELPRPLQEALEAGRIRKEGERRATRYFAAAATAPAKPKAEAPVKARPSRLKKKAAAKRKGRAAR